MKIEGVAQRDLGASVGPDVLLHQAPDLKCRGERGVAASGR